MRRSQPDDYKKLVLLKRIAQASSYSLGYVSILVQRKKLKAKKIGNKYYSTREWFDQYLELHARDGKRPPVEAAKEAPADLKSRIDNLVERAIREKLENTTSSVLPFAEEIEQPEIRKPEEKNLAKALAEKIERPPARFIADLVEPEKKFEREWNKNFEKEKKDLKVAAKEGAKKYRSKISEENKSKNKVGFIFSRRLAFKAAGAFLILFIAFSLFRSAPFINASLNRPAKFARAAAMNQIKFLSYARERLKNNISRRNKILVRKLGAVGEQASFIAGFWRNEYQLNTSRPVQALKFISSRTADKFGDLKFALAIIPDEAERFGLGSFEMLKNFLIFQKQSLGDIANLAGDKSGIRADDEGGRVAGIMEEAEPAPAPFSRLLALANTTSRRGREVVNQVKYNTVNVLENTAERQKELSLTLGQGLAKLTRDSAGGVGLVSRDGKDKLARLEDVINLANDSIRQDSQTGKNYLAGEISRSLWSLNDLYSRFIDKIFPESLKNKYAKYYIPVQQAGSPAGQAGAAPVKETVVVKEITVVRERAGVAAPVAAPAKTTSITGNAVKGGELNVSGPSATVKKLTVTGQADFYGDVTVNAALTAKTLTVTDSASFLGSLSVKDFAADSLTSRGGLTVVGDSFIGGNELISGNLKVAGTFQAGHTEFPSLGVTGSLGAASLSAGAGGLSVSGDTHLNGDNTVIAGAMTLNNVLNINKASGGALTVGDGTTNNLVVDTSSDTVTVNGGFNLNGGLYDSLSSAGSNFQILQSTGSATKWISTSTLFIAGVDTLPTGVSGQTLTYQNSFWTATSSLYVSSAGNVGIGTSSPDALISLLQPENGRPFISAYRITDTAPSGDFINFRTKAGVTMFRVDNSGNLLAGGIINSGSQTITSVSQPQFRLQYDPSNEITTSVGSTGTTTIAINGSAPSLAFTPGTNSVSTFNFTNAASNSILSIDTLNQRVGIGTTTPLSNFHLASGGILIGDSQMDADVTTFTGTNNRIMALSNSNDADTMVLVNNGNNAGGVFISAFKTRETSGSSANTIVASGDSIFEINAYGADGVSYRRAAAIKINVDGTPGSADMPGRISFFTTPDGSATAAERMRINNAGNVGIGTTSPWGLLSVNANGLVAGTPQFVVGSSTRTDLIVTQAGNVGIGTTLPGGSLDIASGQVLIPGGSAAAPGLAFRNDTGLNTGIYRINENDLGISVGGSIWNFGASLAAPNTSATITMGDGSEASPAYTFISRTNSGMYRLNDGTSNLQFATNGSNKLTILEGGNVGIGTTSPQDKLHVWGDLKITGATANHTGFTMFDNYYNASNIFGTKFTKDTESGSIPLRIQTQYNTGTWYNNVIFGHGQAANAPLFGVYGGMVVGANYTGTYAAPSNGLIIEGNIGIGTTTPGSKLEVYNGSVNIGTGNLVTSGNSLVLGDLNSATGGYDSIAAGYGSVASEYRSFAFGTYATASGRDSFAIGSNPVVSGSASFGAGYLAQISGQRSFGFGYIPRVSGGDSVAFGNFLVSGMGSFGINLASTTSQTLSANNTMSIMGGNVGIGTTSPYSMLSVAGQIVGQNFIATSTTATSTFSGGLSAASSLYVLQNGNVGLGIMNPAAKFQVYSAATIPTQILSSYTDTHLVLTTTNGDGRSAVVFENSGDANNAWAAGREFDGTFRIEQTSSATFPGTSRTSRLTIDTSGNVGIGTTSPVSALHIGGSTDLTWGANAYSSGLATLGTPGSYGSLWINSPTGNTTYNAGVGITNTYGTPSNVSVGKIVAYGVKLGGYSSNLAFYTTNGTTLAEAMRIDSSGNVGIGTTTPTQALTVQTAGAGNSAFTVSSSIYGATIGTVNGSSGNTLYLAPKNGNVLIYDNSAQETLHIYNGSAENIVFDSGDKSYISGPSSRFGIGTTTFVNKLSVYGNASIGTTYENVAAPANGLIVAGNVGLGVTSPQSKLNILFGEGSLPADVRGRGVLSEYYGVDAWSGKGGIAVVAGGTKASPTAVSVGGLAALLQPVYYDGTNWRVGATAFSRVSSVSNGANVASALEFWTGTVTGDATTGGFTGLTQQMTIDKNGNVGIGTTTPYAHLSIAGDGALWATAAIQLEDTNANSTARNWVIGNNLNTWGDLNFAVGVSRGANPASAGIKMTIDRSGNVGIGTTSPSAKFSATGSGATTGRLFALSDSNNTERLVVLDNGATGIGVSPVAGYNLSVGTSGMYLAGVGRINWNAGNAQISNPSSAGRTSGYELAFSTYNGSALTEKMTISSSGNVGIGTTSPYSLLSLSNSASTPANTPLFTIASTTAGTATSTLLTVLATGSVGIGTTSPWSTLAVSGTITQTAQKSCANGLTTDANGAINGCAASDISLKTNIASSTYNALSIIGQLSPVSYQWRNPSIKDGLIHSGFIAQSVEAVFPTAITGGGFDEFGNPMKAIDPNAMASLLVKGMQELSASTTAMFENIKFDGKGKIVIGKTSLDNDGEVQIVDITNITASSTQAALVINQAGPGDIADFQTNGVRVMNITSSGEVKIIGSMLVDGRIMLCTGGSCSNTLDSAVDATQADLGVEGKVVAGAFEGYCDPGYVWVPGSAKYGTLPGFCVMSDLTGVNLSQGEAQVACQTLGTGYHLIGENEWLTIAENILQVADNNLATSTAFKLTNDNIVNSLSGVGEWTSQNVTAAGLPITPLADNWFEYGEVSDFKGLNIAPAYYLSDAINHIGKIKTGTGAGLIGFIRGENGIYSLDLSHAPSEHSADIGYRCAK